MTTPTAGAWTWSLALLREDGSTLREQPVELDWEPATEWLRLQAFRGGLAGAERFEAHGRFQPVWHRSAGAPHVEGFRGTLEPERGGEAVDHVFPLRYVAPKADELSRELIRDGELTDGDLFRYRCLAFRVGEMGTPRSGVSEIHGRRREGEPRFSSRPSTPRVPILDGSLSERLADAAPDGEPHRLDVPILVPQSVLDESAELAGRAGDVETGGILIGHLVRDRDVPDACVEITAQIPARGAEADSHRLSFTPEVWTAVRAAIDLRGGDEAMVGWWHSHPVHAWCAECPAERRATCTLRDGFLSAHDRLLHRTVFPRAYCTALVINELGDDERTFSLFGLREGRLEPRGYHRIPAAKRSTEPRALPTGRV